MHENHLQVTRTARYLVLGEPGAHVHEVWFLCHGYGQLASALLRHFEPFNDGTRLFVAPEALSRFYWKREPIQVGASWMTQEDRLHEIEDYVAYLDTLYHHIFATIDRTHVRFRVLGFSQGATTVCRWLCKGTAVADELILWAGGLPHDAQWQTEAEPLRRLRPILVVGDQDEYITPKALTQQIEILEAQHIPHRLITFEGIHRIDAEVLRGLVGV